MHGERAVRVMGNIFAIAQLDMQQKKLRLPNGSVVVMTPCAVPSGAVLNFDVFGVLGLRYYMTRRTSARRSR